MSKKNLDRLFQEKFKDFDAKPNKKVWQNIQNQLEEEKDDRSVFVIPFWVKLSGIAVSLLILLLIGNSLSNSEKEITPIIVDSPQKKEVNTKSNSSKKESKGETLKKDEKIVSNPNQSKEDSSNKQFRSNSNKGTYLTASSSNTFKNSKQKSNSSNYNKSASLNEQNNKIAESSKKENNSNYAFNKVENKKVINEQNETLNQETYNNTLAQNSSKENEANTSLLDTNTKEEEQENAIETAIAEAENEEPNNEKEENYNRWSVYANAAPVYYNSFGEGSHIDEEFNTNNKTGEINTSYGVKIGYALNKKLIIRSGINRLNLSFDTDDVIVFQNVSNSEKFLRNISLYPVNNQSLNLMSTDNAVLQASSLGIQRDAALSQRISYYEVPLEVEYAILDKRFSLNVIGGVSTFFLEDNEVVSELAGFKTTIGKANNINNVSFSTNLGIGLYYDFSQHIQLNIEPTFKYQINAYNNTSGDFNPYIIGLYSGLSYKF